MKINLQAHTELESGYGRMGHFTAKALEKCGVTSCGDIGNGTDGRGEGYDWIDNGVELASVALWLSTPPHVRGWYEGQTAAILTMWESSEMPAGFRANLSYFDRIFVPSEQNLELFSRFHHDVRYCPLGVDEKWSFRPRPPINRDFVFLTAGFGARKGVVQVVEAFKTAFPEGKPLGPLAPIPKLICKSGDDVGGPGITVINSILNGPVERDLYASAHCFVSGSKGEGWGLMPLQAMAQGCPTILGNAHGHAAYADFGIPLDVRDYECKGATFWGDGGHWWEPDFDQMVEAMREVYSDYDHYSRDAAQMADKVRTTFTWEETARTLVANLPEIYNPPPEGRVVHPAPPQLFRVRVNKPVRYVINGTTYAFNPGLDYWEAPDLKRQLIANGHLDLESFDPHELGLEDNVSEEKLERVRATNGVCPTCHQPYNRDTTLAEFFNGR